MRKKLIHPADGIYGFSAQRARELGACFSHLDKWVKRHGEAFVPLTLAGLIVQETDMFGSACYWLVTTSRRLGVLTAAEAFRYIDVYNYAATREECVSTFMDVLLERAKREGRVPS